MHSIGEIAKLTGITAYTLRYYEKIGVLPKPRRQDGVRRYDDEDLRFIRFIHGLKQTGMSLDDIAAFTEDGCLLSGAAQHIDLNETLRKRMEILDRHIGMLNEQIKTLETVRENARGKSAYYSGLFTAHVQKASL